MKAYTVENPNADAQYGLDVYDEDNIGDDIIFANSLEEAKTKYFNLDSLNKTWYDFKKHFKKSDIKFKRMKPLDGYENASEMKIMEQAIQECYWYCFVGDDLFSPDCYNKEDFEREWRKAYPEEDKDESQSKEVDFCKPVGK